MSAPSPSSLPSIALARRLADLCGEERNVQADFLLHLSEFDRRRAYLEAGYGSLWTYCLEVLHLREGAAGRRIAAMKVLRRFPALQAPLRDGRLSLSTANLLGPVLTDETLDDLVARAAFKSMADTEKLVVSIQPRVAAMDGVRKLSGAAVPSAASASASATGIAPIAPVAGSQEATWDAPSASAGAPSPGACSSGAAPATLLTAAMAEVARAEAAAPPLPEPRAELRPISADRYSLRVTIDAACKEELDLLTALLSHTTRGNLGAVLREAIRCGVATHGKRRGAVVPVRKRAERRSAEGAALRTNAESRAASEGAGTAGDGAGSTGKGANAALRTAPPPPCDRPSPSPEVSAARPVTKRARPLDPRSIPLAVRREVWKRDGGRCAWTAPDGKRCGSTWKLEFDHIEAAAVGGPPTAANIRLACKPHNLLHAVKTFGREFMTPFLGEFTIAGESDY